MSTTLNPPSIAAPVGAYSHAVVTPAGGRWLHVSGQVGIAPDGSLAAGFEAQAETVWSNLVAILAAAGMTVNDLVKVSTYLVSGDSLAALNPIRTRYLGSARPASTLVVVKSLARPEWLIEVEVVAHRAD